MTKLGEMILMPLNSFSAPGVKDTLPPEERLRVNTGVELITTYYRTILNMSFMRLDPKFTDFYYQLITQQILTNLMKYDLVNFQLMIKDAVYSGFLMTKDMKTELDIDLFNKLKDAIDMEGDWQESLEAYNPSNWEYTLLKAQVRTIVLGLEKCFGLHQKWGHLNVSFCKNAQQQTNASMSIMPNQFRHFKESFMSYFKGIDSYSYQERKDIVQELIAQLARDLKDPRLLEDVDKFRSYSW